LAFVFNTASQKVKQLSKEASSFDFIKKEKASLLFLPSLPPSFLPSSLLPFLSLSSSLPLFRDFLFLYKFYLPTFF